MSALPSGGGGEGAFPEVFGLPQVLAHPSREDEEEIAQPVRVPERLVADRLDTREGQDAALDPPAHRARLVQEAADAAAAGDEVAAAGDDPVDAVKATAGRAGKDKCVSRRKNESDCLIPAARPWMFQLKEAGLYVSNDLIEETLSRIGE